MLRSFAWVLGLWSSVALAHVGSPDVFFEGDAGPYRVFVTIQPPAAVPGLAQVSVRVAAFGVREVRLTSLPLSGEGSQTPPAPELAVPSALDRQQFSASLWLMTPGSWQATVEVDGPQGPGRIAVPVSALPTQTAAMGERLRGDARRLRAAPRGAVHPDDRRCRAGRRRSSRERSRRALQRRRGYQWQAIALAGVVCLATGGGAWWQAEAKAYGRVVYKPLQLEAQLAAPGKLALRISDPGWLSTRQLDDFVPDHDHLMHLFVVRVPSLDRVFHLHPERIGPGEFTHALPPMPAGRYQLFADVVHATGLAETLVTEVELPEISGKPLEGDDAAGIAQALPATKERTVSALSGGATLRWDRGHRTLRVGEPAPFRFVVEDGKGRPLKDLEPYMGMLGHAAFVKADRSVFAHVHPTGSVPMAALSIAAPVAKGAPAPEHCHPVRASELTFPYGFPSAGWYRVFVQVKRAGQVETATFDVEVLPRA